jgi:hypothetical protein
MLGTCFGNRGPAGSKLHITPPSRRRPRGGGAWRTPSFASDASAGQQRLQEYESRKRTNIQRWTNTIQPSRPSWPRKETEGVDQNQQSPGRNPRQLNCIAVHTRAGWLRSDKPSPNFGPIWRGLLLGLDGVHSRHRRVTADRRGQAEPRLRNRVFQRGGAPLRREPVQNIRIRKLFLDHKTPERL